MKFRQCVLAVCVCLVPALAHANDFGVFRGAIPVEKDVWRLQGGAIISIEDDGREAIVLSGGTGLTANFDFEGKFVISGDDTSLGGGVNYLIMRMDDEIPFDLSVGGGYNYVMHDQQDSSVVNLTAIASKAIDPNFTIYGALTFGFANRDVPAGVDGSTTNVHLVPGAEYKLNEKFDVVGEIGIGFDTAENYIGVVLRYSIR